MNKFNIEKWDEYFLLSLNLNTSRENMEKRFPDLKGKFGITKKGIYRHNPASGFNELVDFETGKFTGRSPY